MNESDTGRTTHTELVIGFLAGVAFSGALVAVTIGERVPALILMTYPIAVAYLEVRRRADVGEGWTDVIRR